MRVGSNDNSEADIGAEESSEAGVLAALEEMSLADVRLLVGEIEAKLKD